MSSRRLMRGRAPSQTFDPSNWQPMFDDDRLWVALARVDLHEGESTHFLLDVDPLGHRVLYVDVVTTPGDIELRCTMPCLPIARIPAIGELVYVELADGRLDFRPAIIGTVGNPSANSGLAEDRWVMQLAPGQKLLIHDGDASEAAPGAKKSDLDILRAVLSAWIVTPTDGGGALKAGLIAAGLIDPTGPTPTPTVSPWPAGTTTLEVK